MAEIALKINLLGGAERTERETLHDVELKLLVARVLMRGNYDAKMVISM